ncbi:hypothetical protein [Glycomyces terrestris]|uniref:Uncharacterized protein n=1 Tax=Glycomyces terrestris TaxID=2493553 RepID=A0A426UZQ4_9ACTN|nr:hypothetical protein [Glycomyces terrestris]RRS00108.1 hypothetical protein EIW28_05800 [Glycomyces terrestris]
MDDFKTAGNAVHGARRVWVPLAVVGVLFALTAVEGLLGRALPDGEALAAGTVIEFGSEEQVSAQVGEGWTLDETASDLGSGLTLTRGQVTVRLSSVVFSAGRPDGVREMWDGMRRALEVEEYAGTDVWLGEPTGFDTRSVSGGLYGSLQIGTAIGTAFVLPGPDGDEAVEAKVLGPFDADQADWDAATSIIDSVAFEDGGERA